MGGELAPRTPGAGPRLVHQRLEAGAQHGQDGPGGSAQLVPQGPGGCAQQLPDGPEVIVELVSRGPGAPAPPPPIEKAGAVRAAIMARATQIREARVWFGLYEWLVFCKMMQQRTRILFGSHLVDVCAVCGDMVPELRDLRHDRRGMCAVACLSSGLVHLVSVRFSNKCALARW